MLDKIEILIKTFLRDVHLVATIKAIQANLPECYMLIVDDGDCTCNKQEAAERLRSDGHQYLWMPFDSGFGAKSNEAIKYVERPYLLVASDDFDFRPPSVREGVIKLATVLERDPSIAIASGRVANRPYEGWLLDDGECVVERRIRYDQPKIVDGVRYHLCNLTVNYSLIRTSIFRTHGIHWDSDVKIGGGEHGAFFLDVMRAGLQVAYVEGVSINEQEGKPMDSRYPSFRARAGATNERPCFKRRGVKEYILFDGSVERVP